jgi:integrase
MQMQVVGEQPSSKRRVRVERGVYRQRNGKYAVCFMLDGKPRFRTVGYDLEVAREERAALMEAARWGVLPVAPQLRFAKVAGWWVARYERKVASGERRERTLEAHRYFVDHHLLPALRGCLVRGITVEHVAGLLGDMRAKGRSEKTIAGALATLHNIMRFAIRNGWIIENPVEKLESDERPRPVRRPQRVLGRNEIARLLDACIPAHRPLIATALYTGMRQSEVLGLIWTDVNLARGSIPVRAQLSRARQGRPARRVAPKTAAALREIPLAPQLVAVLAEHRRQSAFNGGGDWVFTTRCGTPLSQRNAQRRALGRAAHLAGLEDGSVGVRFHDLRHTFASHLIIDICLDVVQVSRILGHASVSTTLDVYAHLFDDARHTADMRRKMEASAFVGLLEPDAGRGNVILLPPANATATTRRSARERAALRWAT